MAFPTLLSTSHIGQLEVLVAQADLAGVQDQAAQGGIGQAAASVHLAGEIDMVQHPLRAVMVGLLQSAQRLVESVNHVLVQLVADASTAGAQRHEEGIGVRLERSARLRASSWLRP